MRGLRRAGLALAVVATAVGAAAAAQPDRNHPRSRAPSRWTADLVAGRPGVAVAPDFLGLSYEDWSLAAAAGDGAATPDLALVRLVRALGGARGLEVRIGGNSADQTVADPALRGVLGVRYVLGARRLAAIRSVLSRAHAHAVLDLNLALRRRGVIAAEVRLARRVLGRGVLRGLAIGNEPDFYAHDRWARRPHVGLVGARARGWGLGAYERELGAAMRQLPRRGPALSGPDLGGDTWTRRLTSYGRAFPRIRTLTVHAYAMTDCRSRGWRRPTTQRLLASRTTHGLLRRVQLAVRAGRILRRPVRVTELNTVACRGAAGVSDALASALWAPDALFSLAAAGASGADIHNSDSVYDPFVVRRHHGRWAARVRPIYYGLLAFERTLGRGGRLVRLLSARPSVVRAWAVRDENGSTRVLITNTDSHRAALARLRLRASSARLSLLTRPAGSRTPILAGQGFGRVTQDGLLRGRLRARVVRVADGRFAIRVPPASVALIAVTAARPPARR